MNNKHNGSEQSQPHEGVQLLRFTHSHTSTWATSPHPMLLLHKLCSKSLSIPKIPCMVYPNYIPYTYSTYPETNWWVSSSFEHRHLQLADRPTALCVTGFPHRRNPSPVSPGDDSPRSNRRLAPALQAQRLDPAPRAKAPPSLERRGGPRRSMFQPKETGGEREREMWESGCSPMFSFSNLGLFYKEARYIITCNLTYYSSIPLGIAGSGWAWHFIVITQPSPHRKDLKKQGPREAHL